jgi:hypothetical protein
LFGSVVMSKSDPVAFERGRTAAINEIQAGRPRLFWGTRGAWGRFFEELFRFRYGVEVEHTDCFVDSELLSYQEGVNSTVIAHIDRKCGEGTFDRARAEVEQFRKKSYETEKRKAEPCVPTLNGGPATPAASSGVTEGPPPVS